MPIKRNHSLVSFILITILIAAACQTQSTQQSPGTSPLSATIKELTGTVSIKPTSSDSFSPASVGMELKINGSIQTGDDGRARLDLSTGTIIRVSPSSLFTLTSNKSSNGSLLTQLYLSLGRVFIILKGGNMDITTPSGVATVRGSYLSVYVDPVTLDVYVTCLEGDCGASNSSGSVNFGGGQKTILFHCNATTGQCTLPNVEPMSPQDFQNWLNENPEAQQVLNEAYATMTAMAATTEPSATTESSATPISATATSAVSSCLTITSPTASNFDAVGPVTFSWEGRSDASKYTLTIHLPNGSDMTFDTTDTSITRYLESMPAGGTYTWDITVYDNAGNAICQTGESTFTKVRYETPVPNRKAPTCNFTNGQNPDSPCYCGLPKNYGKPWCGE